MGDNKKKDEKKKRFRLVLFSIAMSLNIFLVGATVFALASSAVIDVSEEVEGKKEWWRNAAIYQIYPLSFRDKDNDGRGDLKGVIEKIPYLQETGFEAIWLSPIYSSPMKDFGYDISNFTGIHEWYGTMEDFDELADKIHRSGMKLIMDFVPNHSSDKHEWFIKSVKREDRYDDYYVWKDPKGYDKDGKPIPPNNWLSVFYGPAWTYNPSRKQFYLHQFASAQPDLNWRNPKIAEEMENILKFWMKKGVDGFRIDAVPFLFEDSQFKDEPVASPPGKDPLSFDYLSHIYTQNLPETYEIVQKWRQLIDEANAADGESRCFMVEAYASPKETVRYFGTPERPGANFPFNFNLLGLDNKTTAQQVKEKINNWLDLVPPSPFGHSNWVIGNHDQHRIGSKIGVNLIDGMNMINLLLPGTSITYYGEEIGMVNNDDITWEEGVDPQGCNYPKEEFKMRSRDFERTPFQWDNTVNSGFNSGAKTWLPVNKNYKELNLEAQVGQPKSHYTIFTDLMKARKTRCVRDGATLLNVVGEGTLAILRGVSADDLVVALINFSHQTELIDLNAEFLLGKRTFIVLTADEASGFEKGQTVPISEIELPKRSSVVLSTKSS